ncbi:MAG: DUF1501 domain-containing protein [Prosthecobacter sp.]|nr:DUF1501 domain-containing protein [Prosthecobacter sp.]
MPPKINRRNFLRRAGCGAMSGLPLLNTLLNLKLAGSIAAAEPSTSEYRALVCLFFPGGMDSYNLLVPQGATEHAEYATVRKDLALPQASLLPITPLQSAGLDLGLHPGMSGLQTLFGEGRAAFVANVGTLVEPVTRVNFNEGGPNVPLGLFSHSDQIEQWHTSLPDVRSARGWAGRAADLLHSLNSLDTVSMNISLSGGNIWQSGQQVLEYTVEPSGAVGLYGYDPNDTDDWSLTPIRTRAVDTQLATTYGHLLTQAFQDKKLDAMDAYTLFNSATNVTLPGSVVWPESYLSSQLQMVARSIAGHTALGHTRQTFFVQYGGWDHHDEVLNNMASQIPDFSAAVTAFYRTLEALSLQNNVTLFTASDFGRTLTSNGEGSDHAWGGNHTVVGGAVQGGRIYGQYPSLYEDNPLDVGRGRLIPTTSVDAYFAELALWLGVPKSSLPLVIPNIGRFFDTGSSGSPLGFLA